MLTNKSKQQVLFNYLPGKVFDFGKGSIVSRISEVKGYPYADLNAELLIKKISAEIKAWREEYRPALGNKTLDDSSRFIVVDARQASASLYPLVFICPVSNCNRVYDYTTRNDVLSSKICPECKKGKLQQLRFVKIHRCGHIEPLRPPNCHKCGSKKMSLITKSAKISGFVWKCKDCGERNDLNVGVCFQCSWPGDPKQKRMEIELFRSSKTFYVHHTTLINIPQNEYDAFFKTTGWEYISAAKYLELPDAVDLKLSDYARKLNPFGKATVPVTGEELDELFKKHDEGKISEEEFIAETKRLRSRKNASISELKEKVLKDSGLPEAFWDYSKYNVLETNIPFEIGTYKTIPNASVAEAKSRALGFSKVSLIDEFPIILASYGFSRSDSKPNDCFLQPFPSNRDFNGKFPVYIDKVSADALVFKLDPIRVYQWLIANGIKVNLPNGSSLEVSAKSYFLKVFHGLNTHEKIHRDKPEARLVMGLIHTLSHLTIKHSALLCGLDKVSISEYIIPDTLTFAIYCNHRFGAILGALTALFEQSMTELLDQIEIERRCVYDPVCAENNLATCHSCTHLPETSCRFFNVNLSRIYLFGGFDTELNTEIRSFFEIR